MSTSGADYVSELQAQKDRLQGQITTADNLVERTREDAKALGERRGQALGELCEVLLPDGSPAALDRAGHLAGFPALRAKVEQLAAELPSVQERLQALEADPRYRDRQLLRAPRVGTLSRAIDELVDFRAPQQEVVQRASHPRLTRLIDEGYDTPKYDVPFWRMSYYQDWQAADEILERFPKKRRFAEVREEFLSACSTVRVYDERLRALRAEVADGEAVEAEVEKLRARIAGFPAELLAKGRGLIAAHLGDCDAEVLQIVGERVREGAPQAEILLKRFAGLSQQAAYLEKTAQHYQGQEQQALAKEVAKLDRQIEKYSRPKNRYAPVPVEQVQQTRESAQLRFEKSQRRLHELEETRERLVQFDRYDAGRFARDFLWWDLITGGRVHGAFIPEVAEHRRYYPQPHYASDGDDPAWDLAAAATAAAERAERRRRKEEQRQPGYREEQVRDIS